jgi:hypothetical protein
MIKPLLTTSSEFYFFLNDNEKSLKSQIGSHEIVTPLLAQIERLFHFRDI